MKIAKFLDRYGFWSGISGFLLGLGLLLVFQGQVGGIIFGSMCGLIVAGLILRVFLPLVGKG